MGSFTLRPVLHLVSALLLDGLGVLFFGLFGRMQVDGRDGQESQPRNRPDTPPEVEIQSRCCHLIGEWRANLLLVLFVGRNERGKPSQVKSSQVKSGQGRRGGSYHGQEQRKEGLGVGVRRQCKQ